MGQRIKPVRFEFGKDILVQSIEVDSKGGLFKVTNSGAPIDGLIVDIPGGALGKKANIQLGYNDGQLQVRSGKGCGVAAFVRIEPVVTFLKPVKITVPYNVSLNPLAVTGYLIDEEGHLHLLDTEGMNAAKGTVAFYTFKPLLFTWVYIME